MERYPDPNLRMLASSGPALPSEGRNIVVPGRRSRSELTDRLPTFRKSIACGFTSITIPDGVDLINQDAWYPLLDIDVQNTFGQELYLFGVTIDQCSTEYTGASGSNKNRGDGNGGGAAIVIGDGSLPINGKTGWLGAGANLPSISSTSGALADNDRYVYRSFFPSGNFADSPVTRRVVPKSFAPFVYRFPTGARIQVALVTQGLYIRNSTGSDKFIRGQVDVQLHVANTRNPGAFNDAR